MQRRLTCMRLFALTCLLAASADAQDDERLFSRFTTVFDGYLRNATAVRLEKLDQFTQVYNCLQLDYADWLTDTVGVSIVGRAVYDAAYDLHDDWFPEQKEEYGAYLDLREAVMKIIAGDVDIMIGRQQVIWGKADGFRVTDLINPQDYRNQAVTELQDARIPLWMLKLDYYPSLEHALQLLVIPDAQLAKLPEPTLPAGVTAQAREEPDISLSNTEVGLRYSGYLRGWDVTLNYLYAWNDLPAMQRSVSPAGTLTLMPIHRQGHSVGGTFASVVWDGVLRGEVAAHPEALFSFAAPDDADGLIEKTLLAYAVAYERDLFDVHWLAQFFQQRIADYEAGIEADASQSYATLNGSKQFLRETLEVSASIVYQVDDEQWSLNPEIGYDYSDAVNLTAGVEFLVGENTEDAARNAERLYADITYSF